MDSIDVTAIKRDTMSNGYPQHKRILRQVADIQRCGDRMDEWHVNELLKVFNAHFPTRAGREAFFGMSLMPHAFDNEWKISDIKLIKLTLGLESRVSAIV